MELPGPRARYEQLATLIRRDIYAGRWLPGAMLPREIDLAEEHKTSRALANRALQVLADEELVEQVQGRGTSVLPRRLYQVRIAVPFPAGRRPGRAISLRRAVADSAKAEPAVKAVESADLQDRAAVVSLLVEAADGDWAVHAAKVVVKSAGGAWSWEGWDFTLAVYYCAPAEAQPQD